MRDWTNRTELPFGRRFGNATSNRSEVVLEHDKRIIAQVTGPMHAGSLGRSLFRSARLDRLFTRPSTRSMATK